ncbi:NADH-quinone oxidoreductase subunit C [Candidatus Bipolaricaulota bacterium]|nr:NADH-quinone oxidoreductase subunit C [Candidatus Bipolaricaulota bacterium]
MNPSTFKEKLSGRFGWKLGKAKQNSDRLYLNPEPEIFENLVEAIFEDHDGRLATISCVDEENQFRLLYHFVFDGEGFITTVKLPVERDENPSTESIANLIPGAEWIEREIMEMFGIDFQNNPAKKRLLKADSLGDKDFPYRKDFDVENLEEN